MEELLTIEGADWYDPGIDWSPHDFFDPWQTYDVSSVVGDPGGDASLWHQQQTGFTCAVVSQEMILHAFGIEVSEAQLVYDATSHGWLTENGTSPEDMASLLEYYGVETHMADGATSFDLVDELSQGHKIIVGLDSGELYNLDWFGEDLINPYGADHAVMVTGIDMRNPDQPMVVLNDPGHQGGAGVSVPLEQFLDAWDDSGNSYVATDHAPGDLAAHSVFGANFNVLPDGSAQYMDATYWDKFLDAIGQVDDISRRSSMDEDYDFSSLDETSRNQLFLSL